MLWKQTNAHLHELLNGELTDMTLTKLHTWENSGTIILLFRGVTSSMIQSSYIIHRWSMHLCILRYLNLRAAPCFPLLLCGKECVRVSQTSTAHFYKVDIIDRHVFYTNKCMTGLLKLSAQHSWRKLRCYFPIKI